MKLIPVYNRLIVKKAEAANKIGNIFIPDSAKEKPMRGEVLAVNRDAGPEGKLHPVMATLKVGDVVLFRNYSGVEFEGFMVLGGDDILAVVEA